MFENSAWSNMFQILQYNNFLSLYSFIGNTDWTGITINQRYHWMQYVVFVFYIIYAVWLDSQLLKKGNSIYVWNEAIYYKFYIRTELKNK